MKETDAFGDDVNVTPESMRQFANALRKIAERHDEVATWMETDGIPGIRSKNLRSAALSLVPMAKFLGAVVSSYCDQVSATGLEKLAGGVVILNHYLKRTTADLLEREQKKRRKPTAADIAEGHAVAEELAEAGRKLQGQKPKGKAKR
jgi:hypothetical protein